MRIYRLYEVTAALQFCKSMDDIDSVKMALDADKPFYPMATFNQMIAMCVQKSYSLMMK